MTSRSISAGCVEQVFHLTAVVADRDATVRSLRDFLGAAVLHTADGDIFGVEMLRAMLWLGDSLLEVIQPLGDSPFIVFLARLGGGLNSLGLQVSDAQKAEARLAASGVEVAVRFDIDMFATRTAKTAGLPLQFTSRTVEGDPRHGNVLPSRMLGGAVTVKRLAFVAALVEDPPLAGATLAHLFATSVSEIEKRQRPGPQAAVSLGDWCLAL